VSVDSTLEAVNAARSILVTGGAGFIGSALCRFLVRSTTATVVNLDKLTYAARPESLTEIEGSERYRFVRGDICDRALVAEVMRAARPRLVFHLAAESHVDRSITDPDAFVQTNVVGTHVMLEAAQRHWETLDLDGRRTFRFVHVSTDEVYGSIEGAGRFGEEAPYRPRSPYAASKAASDQFAAAWHETYGLPTIISNSCNIYGPYQFPEKLIPLMILNALEGKPLGIYGDGLNRRDWMHVEDQVLGLLLLAARGRAGERYNVAGCAERTNRDVVLSICRLLDELRPAHAPHEELIRYVSDRPGHDRRYALDLTKIETELGWRPRWTFEAGLADTVRWYLANEAWWRPIRDRVYGGERLGLPAGEAAEREPVSTRGGRARGTQRRPARR
jgi:dTDP-glucose 4,6-dehydratase